MIGVDRNLSTFIEMSKVFDRQVDGQEFPIKRAVSGLSGLKLLGEVGDWTPLYPVYSCSTAPTAISEASHIMDFGAFGFGYANSVALASASLAAMKAVIASLDHCSSTLPLLVAPSNL